jgi:predicted nucleic acid-binding protein
MVGLDTSVVVRLLVGEPAGQAEAAHRLLREGPGPVSVSDLVVGEAYFALRHHYRVPHRKAVAALAALLADAAVHATGGAAAVLALAGQAEVPGVMDRLIHADYQRDGVALVTFDREAAKLAGVRLLS